MKIASKSQKILRDIIFGDMLFDYMESVSKYQRMKYQAIKDLFPVEPMPSPCGLDYLPLFKNKKRRNKR